jgi:hypothetical protein
VTNFVPAEQTRDLVQPFTGELIAAGDVPKLAETIDELRALRQRANDAIAAFTQAVADESRRQGTKTLTADGWTVKLSPDSEPGWDVSVLTELLAAGLPEERYHALVTEVVSYKVDANVARQLEGASEVYAEIVGRARSRVPKNPYASVTRSRP